MDVAAVAEENLPARQEEQAKYSMPAVASVRYFPATHSVVQAGEAAEENVPAPQSEHVVDDVAPVADENFPEVQPAHG